MAVDRVRIGPHTVDVSTDEFWVWWETHASLFTLDRQHFVARVVKGAPDREEGVTLHWSDGVANDWAEWYPALEYALTRLAVLVKCEDGSRGFIEDPFRFTHYAHNFLEGQLD